MAEVFGKLHSNVIRDLEKLVDELDEKGKLNFELSSYKPEGAKRSYKKYNLTKDGFTLLVMGFTGKKALQFKMMYINEFNRMEEGLSNFQYECYKNYLQRSYALHF
ncbi:hypothetical protein BTGOE5_53470 [Bacillus thuringiensis]|nr:hypothetical protein BTGOE5_53470 [Bacillus thuringiensis]